MPENDRFVPVRSFSPSVDIEYFRRDTDKKDPNEDDILRQDIKEYMKEAYCKGLQAALGFPKKSSRLLLSGVKVRRFQASSCWPVKPRKRPIIVTPECALDLPDFKAQYAWNVLDWGPKGYLAAALNWSIFLCHPDTNKTIHLTDIDSQHRGEQYGTAVKWDSVGKHLAIGTNKSHIQIWDTTECKDVGDAWCECSTPCSINSLAWNNTNKLIVSGCSSGSLMLIKFHDHIRGRDIRFGHEGGVICLASSPDGTYLASSGNDSAIRLWKWPHLLPYFEIIYNHPSRGLAWHPWHPSLLAVGGGHRCSSISVYNVNSCRQLATTTPQLRCFLLSLAWSRRTGELVASYWVAPGQGRLNGSGYCEVLVLSSLRKVVDKIMSGYPTQVIYLLWSPDGHKIEPRVGRCGLWLSSDNAEPLDRWPCNGATSVALTGTEQCRGWAGSMETAERMKIALGKHFTREQLLAVMRRYESGISQMLNPERRAIKENLPVTGLRVPPVFYYL